MLDQLLVLGIVPGTGFQITFSEILVIMLVFFLYLWERMHHKEIVRAIKYYRKRSLINMRKAKRRTIWFIKRQRKALNLGAYRFKRRQQRRLHRTRLAILRAITLFYRRRVRLMKLRLRRSRRWLLSITIYRVQRWKRQLKRSLRRQNRKLAFAVTRRKKRLQRSFVRRLRRINTKLAQTFYL